MAAALGVLCGNSISGEGPADVMYSISLYSTSQPALISGSGVCRLAGTPRYNYFLTHREQRERARESGKETERG